jgi:tRNA A37 threonylcarbamoyladenosine dehydratase
MSHKEYYMYGSPEVQVIEECSELIKELCKIQRFGWFAIDSKTGVEYNNKEAVKREMDDVIEAIERLAIKMREMK